MDKNDLGKYILSNLERGLSIEEIKEQLLARGFFDYDINVAISKLHLKEFSDVKIEPEEDKTESIEGWDEDLL
jgi:outer membrane protein assembly factor BamA